MLSIGSIGGGSAALPIDSVLTKEPQESEIRKMCLKLRATFSQEDWAKFQSSLTPVRLGYFLGNEHVTGFLQNMLTKYPATKDKGRAMVLKNAGNKSFGSGDNKMAFLRYTQCLAWMAEEGDSG